MNPILLEANFDVFETHKIHRLDLAQIMAVMLAMRIVITHHAAIVEAADVMMDIGKVLANDFTGLIHPDLAAQNSVAPLPRQRVRLIDQISLRHSHDLSYHVCGAQFAHAGAKSPAERWGARCQTSGIFAFKSMWARFAGATRWKNASLTRFGYPFWLANFRSYRSDNYSDAGGLAQHGAGRGVWYDLR